jgi:hypothetical protein
VPPDPEVVAKPTRRQFTAAYRLRILEEADRCTKGRRNIKTSELIATVPTRGRTFYSCG